MQLHSYDAYATLTTSFAVCMLCVLSLCPPPPPPPFLLFLNHHAHGHKRPHTPYRSHAVLRCVQAMQNHFAFPNMPRDLPSIQHMSLHENDGPSLTITGVACVRMYCECLGGRVCVQNNTSRAHACTHA